MGVQWGRGTGEAPALVADRHLYLARDEVTIVEEGDERSGWQFVAKGHPIAPDDAARFGLVLEDGRVVQRRPDAPAAESEKKPAAKKSAKKPSGE